MGNQNHNQRQTQRQNKNQKQKQELGVARVGGAVAGIMAGTALVGIGAAALTGGAVLNAVDFPRSPRQVQLLLLLHAV